MKLKLIDDIFTKMEFGRARIHIMDIVDISMQVPLSFDVLDIVKLHTFIKKHR